MWDNRSMTVFLNLNESRYLLPQDANNPVILAIFEGHNLRQIWHDEQWFFSVVDVIAAITQNQPRARKYWSELRAKLIEEGFAELSDKIGRLKLPASDGKMRETDCANTETMLRIVQSVPSPKAEKFKKWLAEVGNERLEEIADPESALNEWKARAIGSFMGRGFSEKWARNRVDSIIARNAVTGQWALRGIQAEEYPILTDRLHMGSFGLSIQEHMELKGYPVIKRAGRIAHKGDLREGMTAMELAVSTFAENVSTALHIQRDSQGFHEVARDVDDAGGLAKRNRLEIEKLIGEPVVSPANMLHERAGGLWSLLPAPDES